MQPSDRSSLLRLTGIGQVAQFTVDFAVSVLVARLLGPSELGAYSIAVAALLVAQILRSAGIGVFLVQEADLTPRKVASAFGLASTFSVVLALVVLVVRHPVARFYDSAVIADVLLVSSIGYLVAPFQAVAHGVRTRHLQFGRTVTGTLLGSLAGGGTTSLLALAGHGSVSLAWGALANTLVASAVLWWRPPADLRCWPSFSGWREVWRITGWTLGSGLVNQVGVRSSELVIGKTLGIADAALFDRAEMLPRMIWSYVAPPVLAVLAPVMASELRAGHDAKRLTLFRMRLFGCAFVPLLVGLGTQSRPLLLMLYGEQWASSIGPAFWLCLTAALTGQFVVVNPTLLALGRTRQLFTLNIVEQSARIAILLLLGWTSIEAIAVGMNAVALAYSTGAVMIARHAGILDFSDLPSTIMPGLICGVVVFLTGTGCDLAFETMLPTAHLATLVAAGLCMLGAWLLTLFFVERNVLRLMSRVCFGYELRILGSAA